MTYSLHNTHSCSLGLTQVEPASAGFFGLILSGIRAALPVFARRIVPGCTRTRGRPWIYGVSRLAGSGGVSRFPCPLGPRGSLATMAPGARS